VNAGWLYLKKHGSSKNKGNSMIVSLKIHIKSSSRIEDEKKTYSGVRAMRDGFLLLDITDVEYKKYVCCSMIRW
jgi:hypothetical protein